MAKKPEDIKKEYRQSESGTIKILGDAAFSMAAAYGLTNSVFDEINELVDKVNAENKKKYKPCREDKIDPEKSKEYKDKSWAPDCDGCNTGIYKGDLWDNIVGLLAGSKELSSPADPAGCINPYFDNFFSVIPYQFILSYFIRELLSQALGEITKEETREILNETACGPEIITIIEKST